jgi:hypothetical protein
MATRIEGRFEEVCWASEREAKVEEVTLSQLNLHLFLDPEMLAFQFSTRKIDLMER